MPQSKPQDDDTLPNVARGNTNGLISWCLPMLALTAALAIPACTQAADSQAAHKLLSRSWAQYSDGNFTVISDRPRSAVVRQLTQLQRFRQAWLALNNVSAPPTGVIGTDVFLFSHADDLAAFVRNDAYAGMFVPTLRANYMLLADTGRGNFRNEVLFHELAHVLARSVNGRREPLWYAEGSADLHASVKLGERRLVVGRVPRIRLTTLQALRGRPLRLAPVLRRTGFDGTGPMALAEFYAIAWLLTHYLQFGHLTGEQADDLPGKEADQRSALADYLDRYAGGQDPVTAFRRVFGPIEKLEKTLARYLYDTPVERRPAPPQPVASDVTRIPMTLDQAAGALALLAAVTQPQLAQDIIDVAAADKAPPPGLLAIRARLTGAAGDYEGAMQLADRARALDPHDPDIDLAWGNALVSRCAELRMGAGCRLRVVDAVSAFDRVIAARPVDAEALFGRGAALALLLRHTAAIEALEAALAHAPWSAVIHYRLGIAHANARNRASAREHLERANAWSEGSEIGTHASDLLRQLSGARPRPSRQRYLPPATPERIPPQ